MVPSELEHFAANEMEIAVHIHAQRVPRLGHEQVGEWCFTVPEASFGSGDCGDDALELLCREDISPGRVTADA
jgi:hypothetical protein